MSPFLLLLNKRHSAAELRNDAYSKYILRLSLSTRGSNIPKFDFSATYLLKELNHPLRIFPFLFASWH
jgi:hypothetical protein